MTSSRAEEELELLKNKTFPENTHPGNQPDVYVKCPYFPEHLLRRSRLPYHLMKCEKNPNAPKLVACPFNYFHRVLPEKRQEHILLCEDKVMTRFADRIPPSYSHTRKTVLGVKDEKKVIDFSTGNDADDGTEYW